MPKQVISTDKAPGAVGPYSQAIIANGFLFSAGQIPLVPGTKELVAGDISAQTRQSLENIVAVLTAAGTDISKVVKSTVFLQDMNDFAAFNTVYAEFFTENPPARSTVQVAKLPMGALVEIEVIATLD